MFDFNNLYQDFLHPNPNINKKAYLNMYKYFPKRSMEKLFLNLYETNPELRRKSIKALGAFGDITFPSIADVFLSSQNSLLKVSCLKILVRITYNNNFTSLPNSMMEVIYLASKEEDPQIILTLIPLLRQIGDSGILMLKKLCSDENILKSKLAITAFSETGDPTVENCLKEIIESNSRDELILQGAKDALANYYEIKKNK